jgi:hypothetical protein
MKQAFSLIAFLLCLAYTEANAQDVQRRVGEIDFGFQGKITFYIHEFHEGAPLPVPGTFAAIQVCDEQIIECVVFFRLDRDDLLEIRSLIDSSMVLLPTAEPPTEP